MYGKGGSMREVSLVKTWVGAVGMLIAAGSLTGCIGVGYSSGGGWFIWPGGLGLLVVILIVVLVLRRR
jgi:CDP-diglyceride synthetase